MWTNITETKFWQLYRACSINMGSIDLLLLKEIVCLLTNHLKITYPNRIKSYFKTHPVLAGWKVDHYTWQTSLCTVSKHPGSHNCGIGCRQLLCLQWSPILWFHWSLFWMSCLLYLDWISSPFHAAIYYHGYLPCTIDWLAYDLEKNEFNAVRSETQSIHLQRY